MRTLDRPTVRLIARPEIDVQAMRDYLTEIGGEAWVDRLFGPRECDRCEGLGRLNRGTDAEFFCEDCGGSGELPAYNVPDAEGLIEFMGRLCYKSWVPELNKNVTRVREDRGEYLMNIIKTGHGSVLAHAHFSFVIRGLSRVCTAELNRHAAGTDISEQSLRYVRLDDIEFWTPPGLDEATIAEGNELIEAFEAFYTRAVEREFKEGDDFNKKKALTSKLRRWAPLGLATEEGWTGNIRSIRHVIEMRTDSFAEEEIRIVADQIATIMADECPLLFQDYELLPVPDSNAFDWATEYRKV